MPATALRRSITPPYTGWASSEAHTIPVDLAVGSDADGVRRRPLCERMGRRATSPTLSDRARSGRRSRRPMASASLGEAEVGRRCIGHLLRGHRCVSGVVPLGTTLKCPGRRRDHACFIRRESVCRAGSDTTGSARTVTLGDPWDARLRALWRAHLTMALPSIMTCPAAGSRLGPYAASRRWKNYSPSSGRYAAESPVLGLDL